MSTISSTGVSTDFFDLTHVDWKNIVHPYYPTIYPKTTCIPIEEANSYYNIQQPLDIEAIMALVNGVNGVNQLGLKSNDPIQFNYATGSIDREHAPEKSIFICFDAEAIKVFEEDAGGSRHLRASIGYDKINSIHTISKNKLLTVQEIDTLDLSVELRNTQASLSETAVALREAKLYSDFKKDKELANEQASRHILEQKYQLAIKTLKHQEELMRDQESELNHIKQQIADRQQALAHLELEYGA